MCRKILLAITMTFLIGITYNANAGFAEEQYTIKEMTPQVEASLENRRDRYETLQKHKANGSIGENNKGYVEAMSKDEAIVALVEAENKDRKIIYQTIADQNGLTKAINTIEKVFAQVIREKAEVGDKIQMEDGQWVTKK